MKDPSLTDNQIEEIVLRHNGKIINKEYLKNGGINFVTLQCGNSFNYFPHEQHPEYRISVRDLKFKYKLKKSLFCPYCSKPLLVKTDSDKERLWISLKYQIESLGGEVLSPLAYIDATTMYHIKHEDMYFYSTPRQILGLKTYKPEHGKRISESSSKREFINYNRLMEICIKKQIKLITTEKEFLSMLDFESRKDKRGSTDNRIRLTPKQIHLEVIYKNLPFFITVNDLIRPEYLPFPRRQLSEELCRAVFQIIFKNNFIKIRPDWLRNPVTGRNLELDGFALIDNVKIAFEHDGFYHNSEKTKNLDSLKDKLCEKADVKLIRIPELFSKTQLWDLPFLIFERSKVLGIENLIKEKEVSNQKLTDIYLLMSNPKNENIKLEIMKLAKVHNFKIIKFRISNTPGDMGRMYVTLQNINSTKQKTFRALDLIQNIQKVIEKINYANKRNVIPNQRVKNIESGEIFNSISAASKSIGKPPSYLQARLKIDKRTNKFKVINRTPFILFDD
jgi:hypothetical protein